MNLVAKNKLSGEFYLLGITMNADGHYAVSTCHLYADGSLRTRGEVVFTFETKEQAVNKCKSMLRVKFNKRGFVSCSMLDVPPVGRRYLKPDVDTFVEPEEMLRLMDAARREYYVEFDCVDGIEDRFDEGLEYIAMKDLEDEEFFDVYDRYNEPCHCHISRFSRCQKTEIALEAEGRKKKD